MGQYGTCDPDNWDRVKSLLLQYGVHYVLTGHVHGTQSVQIRELEEEDDTLNYSTVGSIGVDFSKDTKELLGKDANGNAELIKKYEELKCYESISGNRNAYNLWTFNSDGLIKEEQFKYIVAEGKGRWINWSEKIFGQEEIAEGIFSAIPQGLPDKTDGTGEFEICKKELLSCIRENKLYKTGHFHWKNSARLNWIDTSYFFCHRDMLSFIVKGVDLIFSRESELEKVDYIIGLGIKGSIMLSYVRFLFPEKLCTYFPENKNEYNRYELNLFENKENRDAIKSIAVLTDVVHSGETVHAFMKEAYKEMKRQADYYVITVIDATPNGNIAVIDEASAIHLFPIVQLKVMDCSWGKEACNIYTEKLAQIYEYKEDLYESH